TYSMGFPLFLAPIYAAFGNSIFHFEFGNAILSFLFAILTWVFLQQRIGNLYASFVGTLLFFSNPLWVEFKGTVLSEPLYCCLSLGVILLGSPLDRNRKWRFGVAGVLLGWALITRSIAITLWGAIAAMAILSWIQTRNRSIRKTIVIN